MCRIAKLSDREDVILGGIVTAQKTGFTKTGKPYGVVTIEDFEGSGEIFMMGEEWGQRAGMFSIGASVYVTGKVKSRYQYNDNGPKDLKIGGVEFLQTIKERAIDRITIQLLTDKVDDTVVNDLTEIINENPTDKVDDTVVNDLTEIINENPGKTKLFFQLRDTTNKHHVLLRSRREGIDVKNQLIDYIETHDGLAYSIN